ncbi:hypothetical protein BO78DRAFT_59363 [Aspergillus sclerotiicarbonarius CBS 121057]|uniref:Uncharacterized protein n=1 Tax=Aspergillus sclerotiicarbonarius (strain CBS 121057 / IBT 28362) TaxID=1448318 RepID=A0A319EGA9_ASPSB|nr:hypothetical protein BO78DRAFT_59363 [Aspergillus sclerotiicarbonarius CBS 121057]
MLSWIQQPPPSFLSIVSFRTTAADMCAMWVISNHGKSSFFFRQRKKTQINNSRLRLQWVLGWVGSPFFACRE